MKKKLIAVGVGVIVLSLLIIGARSMKNRQACQPLAAEDSVAPTTPAAQSGFDALLKNSIALEQKGELLEARDMYKSIVASYASNPDIEDIQKRLEELNMRIVLSAISVPEQTAIREIKPGDSLSMIADEYRTTVELIKRGNGLKTDIIRPGQRLRIWTGRFGVLVDKSQNLLMLKSNGELIKTFNVSTGKDNITPVGTFKIVNKLRDPSWTHDGMLIPAGDPRNILGTRWLGFDIPSYGIHGTTQPESIGQQATAGCVRMLNEEVELLYDFLPVGTEVTVID